MTTINNSSTGYNKNDFNPDIYPDKIEIEEVELFNKTGIIEEKALTESDLEKPTMQLIQELVAQSGFKMSDIKHTKIHGVKEKDENGNPTQENKYESWHPDGKKDKLYAKLYMEYEIELEDDQKNKFSFKFQQPLYTKVRMSDASSTNTDQNVIENKLQAIIAGVRYVTETAIHSKDQKTIDKLSKQTVLRFEYAFSKPGVLNNKTLSLLQKNDPNLSKKNRIGDVIGVYIRKETAIGRIFARLREPILREDKAVDDLLNTHIGGMSCKEVNDRKKARKEFEEACVKYYHSKTEDDHKEAHKIFNNRRILLSDIEEEKPKTSEKEKSKLFEKETPKPFDSLTRYEARAALDRLNDIQEFLNRELPQERHLDLDNLKLDNLPKNGVLKEISQQNERLQNAQKNLKDRLSSNPFTQMPQEIQYSLYTTFPFIYTSQNMTQESLLHELQQELESSFTTLGTIETKRLEEASLPNPDQDKIAKLNATKNDLEQRIEKANVLIEILEKQISIKKEYEKSPDTTFDKKTIEESLEDIKKTSEKKTKEATELKASLIKLTDADVEKKKEIERDLKNLEKDIFVLEIKKSHNASIKSTAEYYDHIQEVQADLKKRATDAIDFIKNKLEELNRHLITAHELYRNDKNDFTPKTIQSMVYLDKARKEVEYEFFKSRITSFQSALKHVLPSLTNDLDIELNAALFETIPHPKREDLDGKID